MSNIITVVMGTKKVVVNMVLLNKAIKRMEMAKRNRVAMEAANAEKLARKDAFQCARLAELNTQV